MGEEVGVVQLAVALVAWTVMVLLMMKLNLEAGNWWFKKLTFGALVAAIGGLVYLAVVLMMKVVGA